MARIIPTKLTALLHSLSLLVVLVIISFSSPALADCECGYSTTVGNDDVQSVFTDLLETNFQVQDDISKNTDWVRQAFNLTSTKARGEFGEMFAVANVQSSFGPHDNNGMDTGSDTGLHLMVQSPQVDGMVPVAEIDSSRLDIWWGSFRAALKLTPYFNDTQEIDMEFLSKDFHDSNSSYPVNLVLQSRQAASKGFDAQRTKNFVKAYLPFNPSLGFHEYRIDYLHERVLFYADDHLMAQMNGSDVPTSGGHLVLQHWSNDNPLWSGGPPKQEAVFTISYVKAYFNSSRAQRQRDWDSRCVNATAPGAVCEIPSLTSGDSQNATSWFFSGQNNMTNNQTIYGKNGGDAVLENLWRPLLAVSLLTCGWMVGM